MKTMHLYDTDTGLKRLIPSGTGSCDVMVGQTHVASIWDTDPQRPNALYIDTGKVSVAESQRVMESLQSNYCNRLAWVANPAAW